MRKILNGFPLWLCLMLCQNSPSHAQLFQLSTLAQFDGTNGSTPSSLTSGNDSLFYGTTSVGGSNNAGVVFSVTTNGVLTTLASFATNIGINPGGALSIGNDGAFYGVTANGGTNTGGTVFRIAVTGELNTVASFIFNINSLKWPNGQNPQTGLTLGENGVFYGTALNGGSNGFGAVFSVTTNGNLGSLIGFNKTNGSFPNAPLVKGQDGLLYGTTTQGGSYDRGTAFSISTNGLLTTLVHFDGNSNGRNPNGALVFGNDGLLYGTTAQGGAFTNGTVFSLTTNGTLNTLVNFNSTNGAIPGAALTIGADGYFYGTTSQGGNTNLNNGLGFGTIFRMKTSGILQVLVSFNGTNGAYPSTKLMLGNDSNLYGTTSKGGIYNNGTIYKLSVSPPVLNISLSPDNTVVLNWTDLFYGLQSAPQVAGTYTNIPGAMSPYTNSISSDQQYFRLVGN